MLLNQCSIIMLIPTKLLQWNEKVLIIFKRLSDVEICNKESRKTNKDSAHCLIR
nr:MAG TPA: hypothetical protein [Caudoviricetes sp.]